MLLRLIVARVLSGLAKETGLCDPGFYCTNSSVTATPNSPGTGGGMCKNGTFCPRGSPEPQTCPPGKYCGAFELAAPSGNCSAGYYCIGGARLSKPMDGVTGNVCPMGSYCPEGSKDHTLCPPGTYSNATQNEALANCLPCTKGWFCSGYGNEKPTNKCSAGFYCPEGQFVPNPSTYNCTLGHYCPRGSTAPLRCNAGYYQDEIGQSGCKVCITIIYYMAKILCAF